MWISESCVSVSEGTVGGCEGHFRGLHIIMWILIKVRVRGWWKLVESCVSVSGWGSVSGVTVHVGGCEVGFPSFLLSVLTLRFFALLTNFFS
jgi:hypothetical protein